MIFNRSWFLLFCVALTLFIGVFAAFGGRWILLVGSFIVLIGFITDKDL